MLFGDPYFRLDIHPQLLQLAGLLGESHRVEHHSVADDIDGVFAKNTGRYRPQYVYLIAEMEGVSGIRPSLESSDHAVIRCEDIDDFSFSFVAPLQAENYIDFHAEINFRVG